jgi:hypothetical protein
MQGGVGLGLVVVLIPGLVWVALPTRLALARSAEAPLQVAPGVPAAPPPPAPTDWSERAADDPPAGERGLRPEEGLPSGTWHLGLVAGYGISHKIFAGRDAKVQFAPVLPQIGYTVTDVHGPFPLRGSVELVLEPTLLVTTRPSATFGEGASLLFRYNVATGTRWVPFFDFGLGILHWDLQLPRILATQFNFTIQGGPGVHYFVTDHLAITGQARLHHISNADIEKPNVGVNSSVYLIGLSYFF